MKSTTTSESTTLLFPDSVEECGIMAWLAKRFEGKKITLEFDTTTHADNWCFPALWLHSDAGSKPGEKE